MLYNIKKRQNIKKGQEREARITPYYIYTRARREGKEKTGTKEGRMDFKKKEGGGVLFSLTGENVFTGRGIIWQREGRKTCRQRGFFE